MKNFIFTMFAMFMMAMSMNAQTVYSNHKFWDNWSVGVEGGVQSNLHDWNAPQGATVGLHIDKQITPVYGLTFEGQTGFNNTANWLHPNQVHVHNGYAVDDVAIFATNRVNLMNWWGGYRGFPRRFEVEALGGLGYGMGFYKDINGDMTHNDNWLVKTGLNLNFNFGKTRAWTVNVSPTVVWGVTDRDGIDLYAGNAVAQINAGVTYHFRTSNGTHSFVKYDIASLNDKINTLRAENEVLKNRPAEVIEVVKEVVRETTNTVSVVAPTAEKIVIGFAFDSAELSPEAKCALDEMSKKYKVASVVAYASYEDKTPVDYNISLSKSRENVIVNYLHELGVTVDASEHLGAVNKESNRIAIVEFK